MRPCPRARPAEGIVRANCGRASYARLGGAELPATLLFDYPFVTAIAGFAHAPSQKGRSGRRGGHR